MQSDNFNSLDDFGVGDDDEEVLIDASGRRPPGAKSGMQNKTVYLFVHSFFI